MFSNLAVAGAPEKFAAMCAACHGAEGAGDGVAAASLKPPPANFTRSEFWAERTDEAVSAAIAKGGAGVGKSAMMPAFSAMLSDEEIAEMVVYLKSLKKP